MSDNRKSALEASAKFLTQLIQKFGKIDCYFKQHRVFRDVKNGAQLIFSGKEPLLVEFDKHGNGLYDVKKRKYNFKKGVFYEEVLWADGWIHEPIPEQVIEHFKKLFDGTL